MPMRWDHESGVPLPVFDAAASSVDDWIVLTGGFDANYRTTGAIQVRHPSRGWLPVGASLWRPRARHIQLTLADGRVMVVGGIEGSLREETTTPLASLELFHPYDARPQFIPLDEPLVGHSVTALPDGRVAIAGGTAVRVFDPRFDAVVAWIPLHEFRQGHSAVLVEADTVSANGGAELVIMGGDRHGSIESVWIDQARAELWPFCFEAPRRDGAAVVVGPDLIWYTGGYDPVSGESVNDCLVVDLATRDLQTTTPFDFENGVAGHRLERSADGRRWHIFGGESRGNGRVRSAPTGRLIDYETGRVWTTPTPPGEFTRRAWLTWNGRPAAIGGYRFVDAKTAAAQGIRAGASIGDTLSWVGGLPLGVMVED